MSPTPISDWLGVEPHVILFAMAPVFLATMAAEWLLLRRAPQRWPVSASYTWPDTLSNICLAALYQASDLLAALVTIHVYEALYAWRLFEIPFNGWTLLLLFILQDFAYYWFHRAHHRIRWFWASHVVHHSSERLNFSTAMRQSITYPITGMWLFWLPLAWIGFPTEAVLFVVAVNLAYQFFIHSQTVPKLGWLEWIFNTPSHHRAHHGRNARYIDRNYGGILIIWDRLLGTFVAEDEKEPVEYGIVNQVYSHNPLYLNFHEWQSMLRDAMQKGLTLRQRLRAIFGPPEGSAAGSHEAPVTQLGDSA